MKQVSVEELRNVFSRTCSLLARLDQLGRYPLLADRVPGLRKKVFGIQQQAETMEATLIAYGSLPFDGQDLKMLADLYRRLEMREDDIVGLETCLSARSRTMTGLCSRLASEVRFPLPPPLVSISDAIGNAEVRSDLNLVLLPEKRSAYRLGLSDLAHEMAHLWYLSELHRAIGNDLVCPPSVFFFSPEVAVPDRVRRDLAEAWSHSWLGELSCDVVATIMMGPAYGWTHLHDMEYTHEGPYHCGLTKEDTHPADHARLMSISMCLDQYGLSTPSARLWSSMEHLTQAQGSIPEEYPQFYPVKLIADIVRATIASCDILVPYSQRTEGEASLPRWVNQAWEVYRQTPSQYVDWEHKTIASLCA